VSDPAGKTAVGSATLTTGPNPIVLENEKPGTPEDIWQIDPDQASTIIQGFTTSISTNLGGTVDFKIDNETGNPNYQVNIYRLGYYGGDGATLVTSIQHQSATAVVQPAPLVDPTTGLIDAGNWQVTDSWTVPTTATSGVYVANVIDGTQVFQIPFIVRDDNSHSDIVFQTADETWEAYNGWGGANLYGGDGPAPTGAAFAVSYNRPFTTRGQSGPPGSDDIGTFAGPQDMVFGAEYPAIQWLEQNGYDVSYIAGLDTATNGSLLLNHKIFMDVGHDEYWTDSQRANVQAAADAGVNLTFLSGNEIFWQTQYEPSIDGSGTADRTLVTYKDSHFGTLINPTGIGTGTFEAPISMGGANLPSNSLTGTFFQVDDGFSNGTAASTTITIPFDMTQLRFWRNTSIANTASGQTASLEPLLLGYEWDSSPDNGFMPAGLVNLSSTTLQVPTVNTQFGSVNVPGTATHNFVEYRDPTSGALVFGAGTVFWSWGLSNDHDGGPTGNSTTTDPNVQQAMVNLFADMGVQPATLQASLVIASQSTDHTPPISKITAMSATNVVEGGTVTVTGTASDVGGVIGGVQVSTDGGNTWHPASGAVGSSSVNWTYSFEAPAPGTYSIESRAVDDSLNLETPGLGTAYSVMPSSAISLFSPSDTPSIPSVSDVSVEVGVKFTSATPAEITAIRFYKGPLNTGTHTADLWSATGALLASATFTNESASGWQQVNLTTPVKTVAGSTYVVSYHTNGNYSDTPGYFDTYTGQVNGSLTALGDGADGVFAYGSSPIFPINTSRSGDNFWVDAVFKDTVNDPLANDDSGFTTIENNSLSIPAPALLANDTDPNGLPLSITGVTNASNGTVSYDPNTQTVSFVPTAAYAGLANFSYTISDGQGTGSGQVSLTVNHPVTAQSLFYTGDTPATVTVNDPNSVEVGVKFQASTAGTITGFRFYKGPQNTGTHVAHLWSATGTLLATATFTNETASGWQQVNLANPIMITAGTTYVVSYHTNGDYSVDGNYFATAHTNGSLTALASGASGGDGLYAYGTGPIFPSNSSNASNYWIDVVFNGSSNQAVANDDSGFIATEKIALSIPASALLANDTDLNSSPLSITSVSNATNGTVSYDPNAQTVSFVPTNGYNGPASFSYSITDGQGGTASANVGILVNDPSAASLFSLTSTPNIVTENDPNSIELGFKFQASQDGEIAGIRFYKSPENTGPHEADLWSSTGTLLATATFTNETASGWQQANFSDPVAITAGTTYVASYHTNGDYSADPNLFATAQTSGPLTAPASSTSGGNGVFAYGSSDLFPTSSFNSTSSGVDVVFKASAIQPPVANNDSGFIATENIALSIPASALLANDTDPNGLPLSIAGVSNASNGTVTYDPSTQTISFVPTPGYTGAAGFAYSIGDGQSATATANVALNVFPPPPVANNDSGFVATESTPLSIPASALLANDTDPNGLPLSITGMSSPSNGTVTYDPSTQTISFVPTDGYTGTASFSYSVSDGNGSASANAALLISDPSVASLFSPTTTPSIVTVNDTNSVELGVKFQASEDGEITGIRFYKSPLNTGTHEADVWSATGTLLATATFSNETASGWQQVNFSNPVAIAAGTAYVAYYHTNGDYSADPNLFATAQTSGLLTAPASSTSGGNGVYAYGSSSLFPTNSFNSTSYGVDVLFKAHLAA
jgi:hypothetical protein